MLQARLELIAVFTPRPQFFNEPLPAEYFDGKGRPLKSVTYATNQGEHGRPCSMLETLL